MKVQSVSNYRNILDTKKGPGWPNGQGSRFKLTCTDHCILSPIWHEFMPGFVPYKNRLRLTCIAHDKVCQLPAQGRWFSPGTLASSTSKTDRRDMTEILLKVALNPNQTNKQTLHCDRSWNTCTYPITLALLEPA